MSATAPAVRPRGGRPTRLDSEQLRERLLDVATELLLTQGYGATSIEEVAARAGVAKRTFYHRFADKPALMEAVVARLIGALRPPRDVPLFDERQSLQEILLHLARLILRAALSPTALALHRLVVAEAQRFPDLAHAVVHEGARREAVALISGLLQRRLPNARLDADSAAFAAQQFLQLIVSLPQSRALGMGPPMSTGELEDWIVRSVALFLDGVAHQAPAPPG